MAFAALRLNPSRRELRQFGLICLFGFGLVGVILRWKWGLETVPLILWGLAPVVAVLGLVSPPAIRPLYIGLSVAAFPIGWVVGTVVMGLTYYILFTGIGMIFRVIGRDALGLRLDRTAPTYWIRRRPTTDSRRYFRQF